MTLRAVASDYFPGRRASESALFHIYVLSKEAHARLIQEQLEKQAAELEELSRKQEALMEAGKQVREQTPEKLAGDESAQKLGDQASEQRENANDLKALAKDMAITVREGLRNSDLSEKLLQDWAKQAEAMSGLSQKGMPEAATSLDSARQQEAARAAELARALAQEEAVLDAMRGLQKTGEVAADTLSSAIIALRLRKIAGTQKEVAATFQKILPETIGMRPEEMPGEQRRIIQQMEVSEETSRTDSAAIQDEIARFFDRTRVTSYGDVSREMEAASIDENLGRLGRIVGQNTSVAAIQGAGEWAGRFDRWAEMLETSSGAKTAGQGESPPMSDKQLQAMLALVRIRQQEASLRDQTVALDKVDQPHAAITTPRALAGTQKELEEAVHRLQLQTGSLLPPDQLEPVRRSMDDAGTLLAQSVTGDATVASQTDAINVLDYLLNGGGGGASGGSSLAMLREMMDMNAASGGSKGTGSMAGGTTDRPNERVAGSHAGAAPGPREVTTTGGKEIQTVPMEFRDALESYYGAIEHAE